MPQWQRPHPMPRTQQKAPLHPPAHSHTTKVPPHLPPLLPPHLPQAPNPLFSGVSSAAYLARFSLQGSSDSGSSDEPIGVGEISVKAHGTKTSTNDHRGIG